MTVANIQKRLKDIVRMVRHMRYVSSSMSDFAKMPIEVIEIHLSASSVGYGCRKDVEYAQWIYRAMRRLGICRLK